MLLLAQLREKTNPLIAAALHLCFPPRCVSCGTDVDAAHSLCADCFAKLQLISDPCCARCGVPFAYELGDGAVCADCMQSPPPYAAARAAMHYDDASRKLITRLKYADKQELVPALAAQLWRVGAALCARADLLIPVPLHPKRQRKRLFNQAALLAYALEKHCGKPVLAGGLLRTENTPPQASLPREARLKNVAHAFRVNHAHAEALRGKVVLLIDDVTTTGATLNACSKALRAAQVAEVLVLTVAKTGRE